MKSCGGFGTFEPLGPEIDFIQTDMRDDRPKLAKVRNPPLEFVASLSGSSGKCRPAGEK